MRHQAKLQAAVAGKRKVTPSSSSSSRARKNNTNKRYCDKTTSDNDNEDYEHADHDVIDDMSLQDLPADIFLTVGNYLSSLDITNFFLATVAQASYRRRRRPRTRRPRPRTRRHDGDDEEEKEEGGDGLQLVFVVQKLLTGSRDASILAAAPPYFQELFQEEWETLMAAQNVLECNLRNVGILLDYLDLTKKHSLRLNGDPSQQQISWPMACGDVYGSVLFSTPHWDWKLLFLFPKWADANQSLNWTLSVDAFVDSIRPEENLGIVTFMEDTDFDILDQFLIDMGFDQLARQFNNNLGLAMMLRQTDRQYRDIRVVRRFESDLYFLPTAYCEGHAEIQETVAASERVAWLLNGTKSFRHMFCYWDSHNTTFFRRHGKRAVLRKVWELVKNLHTSDYDAYFR